MLKWLGRNSVLGFLAVAGLTACAVLIQADPADPRLRSSPATAKFDPQRYRDFHDYIAQSRRYLETNKLYMNPAAAAKELDVAVPFEITPALSCRGGEKATRGIVLVHGLGDVPFAMRDIGEALAARCFLVRSVLLPGHGTRPGDLLTITQRDWRQAVQFGVETLKTDVDEVFVGGFSLGGLLAVHAAAEDPEIRGVIVFSPALYLPWMVSHANWLKSVIEWVDIDPVEDYARYSATPLNAAAQVYALTELLEAALGANAIDAPVFMAQSADDPVIDTGKNRDYFQRYFKHPASRLLTYKRGAADGPDTTDSRIHYVNSFVPEANVYSYSHMAVHIAPHNQHYGAQGDYRFCDDHLNEEDMRACRAAERPWRGEIYGRGSSPEAARVVVRLTYNPKFEQLLGEIDHFLLSAFESS